MLLGSYCAWDLYKSEEIIYAGSCIFYNKKIFGNIKFYFLIKSPPSPPYYWLGGGGLLVVDGFVSSVYAIEYSVTAWPVF